MAAAERYAREQEHMDFAAAQQEDKDGGDMEASLQVVDEKIATWRQRGTYLDSGITVAHEAGITQQQMVRWLHTVAQTPFSGWISQLRIEHAQELMRQHPNWTQEAIARECCFSRRQSFARAFKERTGMTVKEYMEERVTPREPCR